MLRKRKGLLAILLILGTMLVGSYCLTQAASVSRTVTPPPEPDAALLINPGSPDRDLPPLLGQGAFPCKRVLFLDDRLSSTDGSYDSFSTLKSTLVGLGFEVQEILPLEISTSLIAPYDIVVFSLGWYAGGGGQRELTDAEAAVLVEYVKSGKSIFLVGELGRASWSGKWRKSLNRISRNFGITFANNMLCSTASHLNTPADPDGGVDLPVIQTITSRFLGEGVKQFSILWGSTLQAQAPARIVSRSDASSWRDTDCTWNFVIGEWECEQDADQPSGTYGVLAVVDNGAGRILAVGDSSWMVNGWIEVNDNLQLAKNAFTWLGRQPAVKSLTAKPAKGTVPLQVSLTCRAKDPGTRVEEVQWVFGDGTEDTSITDNSTARITHTYGAIGTYAASCTVVDKSGCSSTSRPTVVTVANPTHVTIEGRVTDAGGTTGIGNVIMTGLPGNPATNANGNYTATVPYGWTGTATPTLAGWTFAPTTRSYVNAISNQTGQNYIGTPITLTISGRVSHAGGQLGIMGVVMSGLPGNPTTDTDGNYAATVTYGWSGTVTPTLAGWTFTEPSRNYASVTSTQTGQDYTGTLITLTISGQVRDSAGAGISSVTMSGLPGNPTTDDNGNYAATVTYGWSGTVTPTQAEQSFLPQSRSYSNVTSNQTGQDYTRTIFLWIEGSVMNSSEQGISGVTMVGLPGNPTTDDNGNYAASVPYGWSGAVTPTLNGQSFSPTSRNYSNVTSDQLSQSYTIADVTISGRVYDQFNDPPNISISILGFGASVSTDANGNYSGTVPYGWSGTVTPLWDGITFTPPSRSFSDVTSDQSNQDFEFVTLT